MVEINRKTITLYYVRLASMQLQHNNAPNFIQQQSANK